MFALHRSIVFKSDEEAVKFKESGNNKFMKRNFLEALIEYNKSIAFACTKNVLSLGYANRSAVYLQIDCYDECLKNIEWARENRYPADKLSKLEEREKKCKKLRFKGRNNKKEDPWEFFKLSYPANIKIPWIVECLEVRTTAKYGRGIYATKDLKAGDIISIEDPLISFLTDNSLYKHCYNCFKTFMLNLIPCDKTASMMFCSTTCREDFYAMCDEKGIQVYPGMKLASKLGFSFGGYKMLDDYIETATDIDLKKTIFDFYINNKYDPAYDLGLAMSFLSLKSMYISPISDDLPNDNFVSKKSARQIMGILNINNFICAYDSGDGRLPVFEGTRVSLFRALINHNCVSNINTTLVDNKEVTIVIKPIKAGEQLVHCYHDKYAPDHEFRKILMMDMQQFKCDCDECLYNTHTFKLSNIIIPEMFMNRYDFTEARKILKKGWTIVNSNNESKKVVDDSRLHSLQILNTLAYYATFPC